MLQIGQIVTYESRLWRVGLINESRARLDPIQGSTRTIMETGASFTTYGVSCNVSPTSPLTMVSDSTLTTEEQRRAQKLAGREETSFIVTSTHPEVGMADTAVAEPKKLLKKPVNGATPLGTPTAPKARTAAVPVKASTVAQPTVSAVKVANKERVASLQDAKAKASAARAAAPPKTDKPLRPCACGCGEQVTAYFAQGHDARFKGWMVKIEKGLMKVEDLPPMVRKSYEFKKRGDGYVTTTNYKGEKHVGYYTPKE